MQLMSQNLKIRRNGRGLYDFAEIARLEAMVGDSEGPEETLLKCCSVFAGPDTLDGDEPTNLAKAISAESAPGGGDLAETLGPLAADKKVINLRCRQLEDLARNIMERLKQGMWLKSGVESAHLHFDTLLNSIKNHALGDRLATTQIQKLVDLAQMSQSPDDGKAYYLAAQEVNMRRPECLK
jgi:hypothetical protein